MVFRRLDAELTLNTASYSAGLKVAAAETRTFSAAATESGRATQAGWETAAVGARTYAATVAETSRANVAARVKEGESLMALRGEYAAIAAAAVKGSAEQVAASRLVDEANKKLIASGLEVKAANTGVAASASGIVGVFERVGVRVQSSSGIVGSSMRGITADASAMGAGVGAGVGGAIIAVAAFEVAAVRTFQSTASEVRGFQRVTGAGAEDASRLIYAFHQLGVEPEAAQRAIGLLSRNLVDHADKVADAGIKVDHLRNGNIDLLGTLLNVGDAYKAAGAGAEGNALAASLLGRGYQSLLPILARSREELQGMFADAQKHGVVMSPSDVNNAKEFALAGRELQAAMQGLEMESAKGLVPALTLIAGGLTRVIDLADRAARPVGGLGKVITGVVEAIFPVVAVMDLLSKKQSDNTKVSQDHYLAFAADTEILGTYGVALDDTETSESNLTTSHAQMVAEIKRHSEAMISTASDVGLSQEALATAIGYQGKVGVEAYAAEERAAKDFASAVQQGVDATSSAFLHSVDAVGHFSASSLESAAKATGSIEKNDTRVADSIQRVADLQEQFAEQAGTAREQYAAKVIQSNEKLVDAEQSYADTVDSTNQRIADADRKLAEDRISLAQSVVDAEKLLEDDRLAGQRSVADAQQRLADEEARQSIAFNPAALRRLNDEIQLRDARTAVGRAQESAAAKEQSDLDAITKAKQNQIRTLASDQEAADRTRTESARAVEKAEDNVTKARAEQVKLTEEGLHLGELTLSQQRQMRDAVAAVGKAQADSAKQAVTSTRGVANAIHLSTEDVRKFYAETLAQGRTFSEGIHSAIERGYDPSFISRLLQQGPDEAAPFLEAIVRDHDDTLRDLVNSSEREIDRMDTHLREVSRLTFLATHSTSDQMNADFSAALAVLEQNAGAGGKKTAAAIARELGIGVEEVKRIAGEYGITLADGINPLLAAIGAGTITSVGHGAGGGVPSGVYVGGMAHGGQVPGSGTGDTVPAMLTPGEVVFSVPAVERLGANNLLSLHDQARRGYAAGGFVSASDVPLPPEIDAYGVVGYAGTKTDRYAYDKTIEYVSSGSGRNSGPVPSGDVADWVAAGVALAGKPSSWVSPEVNIAMFESGGDPLAQNNWDSNAAAGTPSKGLMQTIDSTFRAYMVEGHGDIWNPVDNVAAATNYIASRYGDPWNTPGERSLARGGAYQGYELGGLVDALHVGVMDRGGWLEPGWNLNYNGLGVREPVGAMAGGGGGGGGDVIINVVVEGPALGTTADQIADTLAGPLRTVMIGRYGFTDGTTGLG